MKPFVRIILLLIPILFAPQQLAAQFDAVTALFKEVHSITLYGQSGWIDRLDPDGRSSCIFEKVLCGVGTEVLIDVGGAQPSHVELGLGASYLGGLTTNVPAMEFRGALRSFPTVSAYHTRELWEGRFLKLTHVSLERYIGASLGVTELYNALTHDSAGTEREVKGTTFEYGLTGGLYSEVFGAGVFAEYSYRWRRFPTLDYALVDADSGRVPETWPRDLNLSGSVVAVGLQFRLKADPPAPTVQVWRLAEVDARELPAPVAATASGGSVEQTQLVFGSLTLTSKDSSYVLEVVSRRAVLNADGTVESLPGTPAPHRETGKFRVTSGQWSLDPNGRDQPPAAYPITQIGDEFVIRDSRTGAMLTFRKPGAESPTAAADAKKE